MGEAEKTDKTKQSNDADGLEAGWYERRGEDDDDNFERVAAEPSPTVWHDGEHDHDLCKSSCKS